MIHCNGSKERRTSRRLRDKKVDSVRVMYWYRTLVSGLNVTSARALYDRLEPETLKKKLLAGISDNRYGLYARGMHVPGAESVEKGEKLVPGSAGKLNHVIWPLLSPDIVITARNAEKWIKRLRPDVQKIVREEASGTVRRRRQPLDNLRRRASLDAAAGLIILLRLEYESQLRRVLANQRSPKGPADEDWGIQVGDYQLEDIAMALLHVLLIIAPEFDELGIAEPFFELFVERVFPLALRRKCLQLNFAGYPYVAVSKVLHKTAGRLYLIQEGGLTYAQVIVKVLCGPYITPVTLTHPPLAGPDLSLGPPAPAARRTLFINKLQLNADLVRYGYIEDEGMIAWDWPVPYALETDGKRDIVPITDTPDDE